MPVALIESTETRSDAVEKAESLRLDSVPDDGVVFLPGDLYSDEPPCPRKSWVLWEEDGPYPHVIIELLSDSTAKTDRGFKKTLYANVFRTPDYFWFDPVSYEFKGFHILDGQYEELQPNELGHLWSQQLGLFLGIHEEKLRFFTADGVLVPTPEESAELAIAAAETERERAETERQRNERLVAKLRALGVEPD